MRALSFRGTYQDEQGAEEILWHVEGGSRLEFYTTVRGLLVRGFDFDRLETDNRVVADGVLAVDANGALANCTLGGDLPCVVETDGHERATIVRFTLELCDRVDLSVPLPQSLRLSTVIDGTSYEVADHWFEHGVQRLDASLSGGARLKCCVTCLYSDYSPYGHGLTGMSCHRDVKAQYLAVRCKDDYWDVPITEDVMETHLCPEFVRRIPGTGYRG